MADTSVRPTLQGEGGLHRDGDKSAMARYVHWPLLVESGLIWAQNGKVTEDYPDGKYPDVNGRPNYMEGIAWTKMADSMLRHLISWLSGEDTDPESGRPHLAHLNCCLHMLSYNVAEHPELDDRPLKPADGPESATLPLPFGETLQPTYVCPICGYGDQVQIQCPQCEWGMLCWVQQ
jgi:hypothetical protein